MTTAELILEYVRTLAWPVAGILALWIFRQPLTETARRTMQLIKVGLSDRRRRQFLHAAIVVLTVISLWWAGKVLVEHAFPPDSDGKIAWADRGQFGDMFGSITSLLTALNLALLVYAIVLQISETSRQNDIIKWTTNYNYQLEAKKLIAEHEDVLELHGLPPGLSARLGVSKAQIAYVVIDLKAADLYYMIDGRDPVELTDYRLKMLESPIYREIAKSCLERGTMLREGPFRRAMLQQLSILSNTEGST